MHNKRNPDRPVISSLNCHTSKNFEYVSFHLQQIIIQIPSYVKGTNKFIHKLDAIGSVPDNTCLTSLDLNPSTQVSQLQEQKHRRNL